MKVELNRGDLLCLLSGVDPDMKTCIAFQEEGLMVYTGNQHNESWAWATEKLEQSSDEELFRLYLLARPIRIGG